MTEQEIKIARALREVNLPFASKTRMFVTSTALDAWIKPEKELTPKQHRYLVTIAHQYRAQLPAEIVAVVDQLKGVPA